MAMPLLTQISMDIHGVGSMATMIMCKASCGVTNGAKLIQTQANNEPKILYL